MKTIKYLLLLIILMLLGILIYQNSDYFMAATLLNFDLGFKSAFWKLELQNIAFWGICFLLGLILAGSKGLIEKLGFKKELKTKNSLINSLNEQINSLQKELEGFKHDPYIQKDIEQNSLETREVDEKKHAEVETIEEITPELAADSDKENDKSHIADLTGTDKPGT